jgi:DNA-binding IclR family transcriptional regulator
LFTRPLDPEIGVPYLDTLSQTEGHDTLLHPEDDHLLYLDKRESESIIRTSSYMGLKRQPYYGVLGMTLSRSWTMPRGGDSSPFTRLLRLQIKQSRTSTKYSKRLEETRRTGYYIEKVRSSMV